MVHEDNDEIIQLIGNVMGGGCAGLVVAMFSFHIQGF